VTDKVASPDVGTRAAPLSRQAAMSRAIRWVLILPAAIAAWYAALFITIGLYQGVEAICPLGRIESGRCLAPWFLSASDAFIALGAALAAALIMVACTLLAPTHKRHVAIATFVAGTVTAIMAGWRDFESAVLAAIVSGAIVLATLYLRLAPLSPPIKSLERTREG
jgi:hypothetical protein